MKIIDSIRFLLIPFIPLYALGVWIRNFLFNTGKLTTTKVKTFVVVVGNLSVGGSGKTPFTIMVTSMLKEMKLKVAVLSRGYGRTSKGYLLVSNGSELFASVADAGDEMVQTVTDCEVPGAVCEDRVAGANRLITDFTVDALVLDDAFQHRWIERDLNIALFDQRFFTQRNPLRRLLLPTGNLREPFSQVKRADCIVINRKFSQKENIPECYTSAMKGIRTFNAHYNIVGFVDVRNDKFFPAEEFLGQKSLLVCGIANPHSFITALKSVHISTDERLIFKDHKFYTNDEVQLMRKVFYDKNCYSVITTHKDAVKLTQFSDELDDIDIYYLKIEMKLDEEQEFKNYLHQKFESYKKGN